MDAGNSFYLSVKGVLFDRSQTSLLQYPDALIGDYTIPEGVTEIVDSAFQDCWGLTAVTISASVSGIGDSSFQNCSNLTSITIPATVTSIRGQAFFGCTGLTNIRIPGSITNVEDNEFNGCTSLTNVTILDGITSIWQQAFYGCTSLTSIRIPGSVTNIEEDALYYCLSLKSVYFTGNAPIADDSVFDYDNAATAYYLPGTKGWSSIFAGRPALLWNPLTQTDDVGFGVNSNQFGFTISGTPNIPVVVESSPNLSAPVWTQLQTVTLTNGLFHFNEPIQPNSLGRFYRLNFP